MGALDGVGVLVTRPEQQSAPLCRRLELAGALAVPLPMIEIQPVVDVRELAARLGPLGQFDVVIFTSANAVRFGAELLAQPAEPAVAERARTVIAAIGPATARALDAAGHPAAVVPAGGFDSENLLRHPVLLEPAGRHVLIVKGMHGRDLLLETLTQRGAQVTVAVVYKRERVVHDAAHLAALEHRLAAGEIQVVTATSAEIAASLLETARPGLRRALENVHWVVPGGRVASALREKGLTAPLLRADTAEDHDLVSAIVRWRSSVSGA
jgi:uroporphyrinogen-III synthase